MRTRDWPIRSKLTALVVVPVTALLALWIFATTLTFGPALDLLSARTFRYDLGRPGDAVVAELQRERRLTVEQLAGTRALPALAEQRERTDRALTELRRRVTGEELRDAADASLQARIDQLVTALDALPAGRGFIDQRRLDRAGAFGLYNGMIGSAFQAFSATATLPEPELNQESRALTELGRSRELLAQADALLSGVVTAGRYAEGEHARLVQIIGNHRFLTEDAVADLPAAERAAYQRLTEQPAFARLREMQDRLVAGDPRTVPSVDPAGWQASYDEVQQQLREYELDAADGLADRSVPNAIRILVRLAVAGVLGLVAVVASVLVAVRVGRTLARRLSGVRTAALELAEARLPEVVTRLRRGEQVDVAREAPPLEYGDDEIGQVGRAFNEVQRTAIRAAVDEVTLRRGLNEVFLNIARRSQSLVHRQLALLDRMERGTEDPDELAELFQVDHIATRLRRHAEDLVILAGAAPGRGWRNPVAVVDLVRGAISEVEAYDRVDIVDVQPAGVLGRAVGDVIHLLAELIENATAFSPPATRVSVNGQRVANGYALEVTDRGLGMSDAALEDAGRRLSRSPEFDPAESARLGLFVVARLAARHAVRVNLRRSEAGGITAVVLIPAELVTDEPAPGVGDVVGRVPERRLTAARSGAAPRPRVATSRRTAAPVPTTAGPDAVAEQLAPGAPPLPVEAPPSTEAGETSPSDLDGLPRRVRRRPPPAPSAHPADDTPTPRPPEEVRRVMAALQAGTARGRAAASTGPVPGAGPDVARGRVVASTGPAPGVGPDPARGRVVASTGPAPGTSPDPAPPSGTPMAGREPTDPERDA
ncbi:sensor histidine kinase [Micromonospora musae]|uniref:sensor histidine kinase n=1 Tax=Micromonospora musae TaxID=1894970 RepID=UPI00341CA769